MMFSQTVRFFHCILSIALDPLLILLLLLLVLCWIVCLAVPGLQESNEGEIDRESFSQGAQ